MLVFKFFFLYMCVSDWIISKKKAKKKKPPSSKELMDKVHSINAVMKRDVLCSVVIKKKKDWTNLVVLNSNVG